MLPAGPFDHLSLTTAPARVRRVTISAVLVLVAVVAARSSPSPPTWRQGYVAPGSLHHDAAGRYHFVLTSCGHTIRVSAFAPPPDTFRDHAYVRIEGAVAGDGFHATTVRARRPTRYTYPPTIDARMCDGRMVRALP